MLYTDFVKNRNDIENINWILAKKLLNDFASLFSISNLVEENNSAIINELISTYFSRKKGLKNYLNVIDMDSREWEKFRILIPFRKKNKMGYADNLKNVIVPCVYDSCELFNKEYGRVEINQKYGIVNHEGIEIEKVIYDEIKITSNHTFIFKSNGKFYFTKIGNANVKRYEGYDYIEDLGNGLFLTYTGEISKDDWPIHYSIDFKENWKGKWGIAEIDKVIFKCEFDFIYKINENCLVVRKEKMWNYWQLLNIDKSDSNYNNSKLYIESYTFPYNEIKFDIPMIPCQ